MVLELLPSEQSLYRGKANAVVRPTDYGLGLFAAGDLLGLVGMKGKEAIGGHLEVTNLRVAFEAHGFNRLRGTFSTPLHAVLSANRYASGLTVGLEINTKAANLQFVSWSPSKAIEAIALAKTMFGPAEQELMDKLSSSVSDQFEIQPIAEAINSVAAAIFGATGAKPAGLSLLSRVEFNSVRRGSSQACD